MFSDKKTKKEATVNSGRNLVGHSTKIKGDIVSDGDFRVDGNLDGNIKTSGRLIVGKEAIITGTITCANADIEGKISGTLNCSGTLSLKSSAIIDGEVFIEKLSVEPGATFNAACSMKGIKALNNDKATKTTEKTA